MAWKVSLIIANCPGCGICADVCSCKALEMTREMAYPEPIPDKCEGCNSCAEECPFDAIEVSEIAAVGS